MSIDIRSLPVIDTHQHLWDLHILSLAWLRDPPFDKLGRSFLPADYTMATSEFNVVKTVYIEVDALPTEHPAEADFILGLCRAADSRVAGAVLGGRPADAAFPGWVSRFRNEPFVKGFREVLFDRPAGHCLQESFIRGVRRLGESGLSFDIEAPVETLSDTISLIHACPQTQFVLDHCGHPDLRLVEDLRWKQLVSQCAARNNVVVKISGAFSGGELPPQGRERLRQAIGHLLNEFGPERAIFGSDWPVVTLSSSFADWADAVWEAVSGRTRSDLHKLFHENAVRIYRLD